MKNENPYNFQVGGEYWLDPEELFKGNIKFIDPSPIDPSAPKLEIVEVNRKNRTITVRSK
jgi:hypothetical protein